MVLKGLTADHVNLDAAPGRWEDELARGERDPLQFGSPACVGPTCQGHHCRAAADLVPARGAASTAPQGLDCCFSR